MTTAHSRRAQRANRVRASGCGRCAQRREWARAILSNPRLPLFALAHHRHVGSAAAARVRAAHTPHSGAAAATRTASALVLFLCRASARGAHRVLQVSWQRRVVFATLRQSSRSAPGMHHPPTHPLPLRARNAENHYNVLAEYYGVPSLSFRNAIWPLMQANASGYRVDLPVDCLLMKHQIPPYCKLYEELIRQRGGNPNSIHPRSQLFAGEDVGGRVSSGGGVPCAAAATGHPPPPPPPPCRRIPRRPGAPCGGHWAPLPGRAAHVLAAAGRK